MFDIDTNNNVIIKQPVLLLLEEFKSIWDKDTSNNKAFANKQFAYLYLKNDFKSPYRNAYSNDEIEKVLKKDLGFENTWKPTKELISAEKKYSDLQTTKSLKVLIAAESALEEITKYFNEFKLNDLDIEDRADAVSKLMKNMQSIDDVVGKLEAAKDKVARELETKKLSGVKVLTSRELPKSKRK
jgi:TusA-related sulfurtransferase